MDVLGKKGAESISFSFKANCAACVEIDACLCKRKEKKKFMTTVWLPLCCQSHPEGIQQCYRHPIGKKDKQKNGKQHRK